MFILYLSKTIRSIQIYFLQFSGSFAKFIDPETVTNKTIQYEGGVTYDKPELVWG